MINLTDETVTLAERIAGAQHVTVDAAIRAALEELAKNRHIDIGVTRLERRRLSIEEMLAVGDEIAAMPLLDSRSPQEIMDDLNTP
jgi:antitoxin VapB